MKRHTIVTFIPAGWLVRTTVWYNSNYSANPACSIHSTAIVIEDPDYTIDPRSFKEDDTL